MGIVQTLTDKKKQERTVEFTSLIMGKKILIATEKPFAKVALDGIVNILESAGFEAVALEKYTDKAQLLGAVADVEGIIIRSDKITAEVVDAAPNLKIVVRAGAGYDNVDLEACTRRGIVVMNTPGQNSNAVAELAIGMMIYMARGRFTPGTGSEISGKTLGIHAYGNVGSLVGKYGKAMGMTVLAFDPFVADKQIFAHDGVTEVDSVEELYRRSDYVSLHIPATDKTRKSIGQSLLSLMPKGGTLVNTARKEVIDEEGLVKALTERPDLKYATDIAADLQAILNEKFGTRVFATQKKMGAETAEANINAGLAAARQTVGFLVDGERKFQVNK
ncbi:D-3-phosphoglycerate dehydrogenase [Bacteroidia bacterium]|nr:D-3-phosphoglycerate dehydrogenase [Bacteroidia bacterium]